MSSISVEDYIKAIYDLQRQHERATTRRLAEQLNVRMASVTGMVKHLATNGYVIHKPYRGVTLTDKGLRTAMTVLRRHRLIELFLQETLKLPWDQVHEDAERLEHAVSEQLIEHIFEYLGRPQFDPHGAPIPDRDGNMPVLNGRQLSECEPGSALELVHVSDKDAEFLRYLSDIGLTIGSRFTLGHQKRNDALLTVQVDQDAIEIDREAAERLVVRPLE